MPLHEEMKCNPISVYDISKLSAEKYLYSQFKLFDVNTTSVRFSNIYGPGDPQGPYRSAVSNFIGQVLRGESPTLHFEGKATRDFIYIDDIVDALILTGLSSETSGEVINLCTGVETSVKKLTDLIINFSEINIKSKLIPANEYYSSNMVGSPKKAHSLSNFRYKINVENGILKTVKWAKENYELFSQLQPYSYLK